MSKFEDMVNSIGGSGFVQGAKDFFGGIGNWFKNAYEDVSDFLTGKNETVRNATQNIINKTDPIADKISNGFNNTMQDIADRASMNPLDTNIPDWISSLINGEDPTKKEPTEEESPNEEPKTSQDEILKEMEERDDKWDLKTVKEIKEEEQQKTAEDESPNENNPTTKGENDDLLQEIFGKSEEMIKKYWEREDAIRKETQDREDTAYQRAVKDMLKAGINPNLINVQPASAGGGITNASRIEETGSAQINMLTQEIVQAISNNVKIEENQKSRLSEIIRSVVTALIFKG